MNDPRHAPQPTRPGGQPASPPQRPGIAAQPLRPAPTDDGLEPLALVEELEEVEESPATPKKIIAFDGVSQHKKHEWKRKTSCDGAGACRVKSFHGKYSDQGLEYLDNAINEWLDAHPDVEVKFVTSTVATFEGKIREPALVLNLWY
jgi:hypothetical protein